MNIFKLKDKFNRNFLLPKYRKMDVLILNLWAFTVLLIDYQVIVRAVSSLVLSPLHGPFQRHLLWLLCIENVLVDFQVTLTVKSS